MALKRKIDDTTVDPTVSATPITIGGKEYNLCFDYGALAEAETFYRKQGHDVNLLFSLPEMTLASTRINFACAIRKFHPDVTFEQAVSMVNLRTMQLIAGAVASAWYKEVPELLTGDSKNV